MGYQIGICDDEVYQIKVNSLYLQEIAKKNGYEFEYHGFQSANQLMQYLEKQALDILFLDIDLGQDNGIQIAAWVAEHYPGVITIFVTGHREFALEAFEVEAMGYLVKPYEIKKLESVMSKIMRKFDTSASQKIPAEIIITDENLKKKVPVDQIIYIERLKAKSYIYTKENEYQVYETITSLCERIGDSFLRVNQGVVVNKALIAQIKRDCVTLKDGTVFTIGRTYRKQVKEIYFGS